MLFLLVTALNQLTHGPMNVFFTLRPSHGYTAFEAGQLWAIGVLAEVVLFFVLPHFIRSIDLRLLLTLSLVFGSMRWVLIGIYPDWPWLLIGLQLLHAFTFGAIHSVSIEFIRRWFPGKLSGRGMALYSGFVFGLGGSLGATLSGITWETLGGSMTFIAQGCDRIYRLSCLVWSQEGAIRCNLCSQELWYLRFSDRLFGVFSTEIEMPGRTLYDKLWDSHLVTQRDDGSALIYIDRHLLHEVTSPRPLRVSVAERKPWRLSANRRP